MSEIDTTPLPMVSADQLAQKNRRPSVFECCQRYNLPHRWCYLRDTHVTKSFCQSMVEGEGCPHLKDCEANNDETKLEKK